MAKDDLDKSIKDAIDEIKMEDRTNNPSPEQRRITAKKGPLALSETFEEGSRYPATKAAYTSKSGRSYSSEYNPNDKSLEFATENGGVEPSVNLSKGKIGFGLKVPLKKGGAVKAKRIRGHGIEKKGKTKGRFV